MTDTFPLSKETSARVGGILRAEIARLSATGTCWEDGCECEVSADYSFCAAHRSRPHFTHRFCMCDACEAEFRPPK